MKKLSFLLVCIFTLIISNGLQAQQNPVDSLLNKLKTVNTDTAKVNILNQLADILKGRDNDKAEEYSSQALELADKANYQKGIADGLKTKGVIEFMKGDFDTAFESMNKSRETYEKMGDKKGMAACYNNLGIFNRNLGELSASQENFSKALDLFKEIEDKEGIAKTYLNLGNLYKQKGDLNMAMESYLESLKFFEEAKIKNQVAKLYQNIGILWGELNENEKAVENFDKALKIFTEVEDIKGIAEVNNNIGNNYAEEKEYETAILYFEKSLKLFREMGNNPMIARLYYNLGDANNKMKKLDAAKEYFDNSLEIYDKLNNPPGLALCYSGLGEYYYNIGDYKKSIAHLEKAKNLILNADIKVSTDAAEWLSKAYAKSGNYKMAYENHVLFKLLNDSIYNENTDKKITAKSMQYEFDQKDKIRKVEEQKKEELQKEKDKRDFLVKMGLSLLVLFMLIIAVITILNYRRKVKANRLLKAQKEEIQFQKVELEQRNEEILAQRDEIEDKNKLITEQRDIALRQKQEITDSIQYAQRIQEAVLPDKFIFGDIEDYFILFKPKDIVSGDFYWMTKADDKLIVIAADCTGHGVPGAFMSMLGVTFLNEIINKDRILVANEILNKLREKVIESLHQKDRETKDGMDISVAVIDPAKRELQYAGAYNPIYYINSGQTEISEITKIPADRMPIGIHIRMDKGFTNHSIHYSKGDTIYMFSDGYQDQFGGENNHKLKSEKFRELLFSIHDRQMADQKDLLEGFFQKWRGEHEQLDDIIVIGLKL
jgi:serine phosphatase RsbU (regulator of sigma subunit)/Tfp pilus assembly protein PilF